MKKETKKITVKELASKFNKDDYLNELQEIDEKLQELFNNMVTHEAQAVVINFQDTLNYLITKRKRKIYTDLTGDEFGRNGIDY